MHLRSSLSFEAEKNIGHSSLGRYLLITKLVCYKIVLTLDKELFRKVKVPRAKLLPNLQNPTLSPLNLSRTQALHNISRQLKREP